MNFAIVRYLIGWLMGIESLFLLLPAFTAVIYREPELPAYIATALICMVGAGILCEYKPKNTKFYAREGFVAVALCWLVLALPIGLLCGGIGTAFHLAVEAVTELRGAHGWLLWLLPAAGLARQGMLPGVDAKALAGAKIDEKQMAHTEAIIQSMTPKERDNPSIINYSRKKRIANGCGLSVEQVNKLLKQFEAMQKMTKQLTSMARSKGKKRRGFPGLGNFKLPF